MTLKSSKSTYIPSLLSPDTMDSEKDMPYTTHSYSSGLNMDQPQPGQANRNPCYITVENEQGELQEYQIDVREDGFTVNPRLLLHGAREKLKRWRSEGNDLDSEQIIRPELIRELSKNARKRLVAKSGHCNVQLKNVPQKKRAFIKDVFTTAIDMPWRYTILAFGLSFITTWTLFAVFYYIIAFSHGDLEEDNLPDGINQKSGNFTPCVWSINNFASCYLFSVETQHTIGYGARMTSEECPQAILLMSLQSIVGVMFSSCMAGLVFAKLARPKNRIHTVVFSKNAVISSRNGQLFLVFRIGNLRKSHLIEAHIRVNLVHAKKTTQEGETHFFGLRRT